MNPEIPGGIAIVGMAGRFPGAHSPAAFWENLKYGVESIAQFKAEELEVGDPAIHAANPAYVRARGVLEGADLFDAGFFGIYPQEAALMDPQHRIFLECCWEALEDAGIDPARDSGLTGVFAGCSQNSYFLTQVNEGGQYLRDYAEAYQVGFYPALLGSIGDTLATRVSHKLNLRGPSMSILSACSTSLVAVCQSVSQLLTYGCDTALAGGVSISFPQKRGYLYQEGGMVSPDGHCRTFDAQAQGTVFGSGAGVVVLKRLEDAIAQGHSIYAVIRGTGQNNDGADKVAFTAPSAKGQAQAIAMAQAAAGVEARSITYIEAHGTGTPLGDPIEVAALTEVFRESTPDIGFCALGTAKTNIGHLDAAAGVSGLIKTALSIRHRQLPPLPHFTRPNPELRLETSPFYINTRLTEWNPGFPLRAGVSAFGVGGTNAHVVVEEPPPREASAAARPVQVLLLSAKSAEALDTASANLATHLERNPGIPPADAAFTLQIGRSRFPYRRAVTCRATADAVSALRGHAVQPSIAPANAPAVHFLFPGQGTQQPGMGFELYQTEPYFRECVDTCGEILRPHLGTDLLRVLYPPDPQAPAAQETLNQTCFAQPAIFVVEYALARLWMHWGIRPQFMTGHSVGEFACACLAGVFSLEDALGLIAARGKLMQNLPGGAMLSVRRPVDEMTPLLGDSLSIAAVNAPSLCVISGPFDAVRALEERLQAGNIVHRRLQTSHAFHSAMMDPILASFAEATGKITFRAPERPYLSGVTGTWITAAEATSPLYWARHFRQPVRFSQCVSQLRGTPEDVLLEIGPGTTLQTLARQHPSPSGSQQVILSSLSGAMDSGSLLECLGQLWAAGIEPDWPKYYQAERRRRVSLPTYAFERKRYWAEPPKLTPEPMQPAVSRIDRLVRETASVLEDLSGLDAAGLAASASFLERKRYWTEPPKLTHEPMQPAVPAVSRIDRLVRETTSVLEDLSGLDAARWEASASFLELGFDSLFLTQAAQSVQTKFGVKVTFRQLMGQESSIQALAEYLDANLPSGATVSAPAPVSDAADPPLIEKVMREQLQTMSELMTRQLEFLRGGASPSKPAPAVPTECKPFGPFKPIQRSAAADLTARQTAHIAALTVRYNQRTRQSKELTQRYRKVLADPRVASGFRMPWKDLVYPIVTNRSRGARLWDVDGNEYIDLLNGFGPIALGHMPDFLADAITEQLRQGIEVGPQTPLAGPVAELLCELTGMERATFCNTGSEAVMAALRLARTVTGRKKVVMFAGDYHGNFEEVLVKRIGRGDAMRTVPIAPGMTPESVANVVVLDYGSPEALDYIRNNASDLAAVLVEPVQSRHPALRPLEFLREVRRITETSGTALIFDEVVTGFRVHLGGAQAMYGIRADMAAYGKILGGGLPIGAIAGKAAFMDALDGGMWDYGDDSTPEAGMTFFAGTFVRHPLAMAAALAVLKHLKEAGPALQETLTRQTESLAARLNVLFERFRVPSRIETCGSWFYFGFPIEFRFGPLLYYHLREKGIHIQEGFPCFLTTAHTGADIDRIALAFDETLREMKAGDMLPVSAGTEDEPVEAPLTEAQLEIWLSTQLAPEASCAFNESFTLQLSGPLDRPALLAGVREILKRHQILRARFDVEEPRMLFQREATVEIQVLDYSAQPERTQQLAQLIARESRTPFDLVHGPVVRIHLVRMEPESHLLVWTSHHIVCDGWSTNVIMEELGALYSGHRAQLPVPLPYGAYALRQKAMGEDAAVERYWLDQFAEPALVLDLPTDRPRPPLKSFAGATLRFPIGPELYAAVKQIGARHKATLFGTLLAAFNALLFRLTNQDDVVVGIPAAAQSLLDGETLVGHCVNFLALRSRLQPDDTFADLLERTRSTVLNAYDHQTYTYGTLVRKLGVRRDPSRLPLIEVQFNLERAGARTRFAGLHSQIEANPKAAVNFDLFWNIVEGASGLTIDCDYNTDLFDEATVQRWLTHYQTLLAAAAKDMTQPVTRLPLLSSEEQRQLTAAHNRQGDEYPRHRLIHELFEEQAAAAPAAIAACFGAERITYLELNARANRLARYLSREGVAPRDRVAIHMDRSLAMLESLLAVLKCGAAYVPLDPMLPPERVSFILREAQVKAVLTQESEAAGLDGNGARIIRLDSGRASIDREIADPLPCLAGPEDLAYVIYTSGSTGKPKGVEISHRAVVNFLWSMRRQPGMGPQDRLLAVTTLSFDIAGLEMFLPLIAGGRVVIASREAIADGNLLAALIRDSGITILQATPATWRLLLEAGWTPGRGLKMLCGGEALPRSLASRLLAGDGELWNMYGPTETTIWSAVSRVQPGEGPVLIGPPIANTQFYVMDKVGQFAPPGAPGELYIGGDGVARGYFLRPELTGDRFVADPFRPHAGACLYKTGDLVRLLPDGYIEFLGRLDRQVKLRGFRIELGEIEALIAACPGVRETVVTLMEPRPGEQRLIAYVAIDAERSPSFQAWRDLLDPQLPAYMIPSLFVRMDRLPKTPNGKLDHRALPAPDVSSAGSERQYRAPSNEKESSLARICAEVLGRGRVGIGDNLFELGADSLHIFQIAARATRAGIAVSAQQVMRNPSVEALSAVVAGDGTKPAGGSIRRVAREDFRTVTK